MRVPRLILILLPGNHRATHYENVSSSDFAESWRLSQVVISCVSTLETTCWQRSPSVELEGIVRHWMRRLQLVIVSLSLNEERCGSEMDCPVRVDKLSEMTFSNVNVLSIGIASSNDNNGDNEKYGSAANSERSVRSENIRESQHMKRQSRSVRL